MNNTDTTRALSALQAIPPDLPRDQWVKAGMGAHASGLTLEDFDSWSAGAGAPVYDQAAVREVWRSFKDSPAGVGPGSLIHMAKQHGWADTGNHHRPSQEELAKRQEQAAASQAEIAKEQAQAAAWAAAIIEVATPATVDTPYLERKGLQTIGDLYEIDAQQAARILGYTPKFKGEPLQGRLLVVPIQRNGKVCSLELIDGDKRKTALAGRETKTEGYWATISPLPESVTDVDIAEGVADVLTCNAAGASLAVSAFSDSNITKVAQVMRQLYPAARITIPADLDKKTGRPNQHAIAAARAVGGLLAVPSFGPDRLPHHKDIDDLRAVFGLDAVRRCLAEAQPVAEDPREPQQTEQPQDKMDGDDATVDGARYLRSVETVCGNALKPKPIDWLWKNWLPRGKLTLLAGQPGTGKTTIAMAVAATLTIGGKWPDGDRCQAGNVLIWSGEDDPTDTLVPRLMASGADVSRVHFIAHTRIGGGEPQPFDPATDMVALRAAVDRIGNVRLIVLDPVSTAVQGDSHKNTEVRRGLQPVVDLATATNAAVLGISHLTKGGTGTDPMNRVLGSIAFVALARVVLVAAKIQGVDGVEKRILVRAKSNLGPDSGGFEYHLDMVQALPGIDASRAAWGEAVAGTARELMAEQPEDDGRESEDQNDLVEMLKAELVCDCWTPSQNVSKSLKGEGFSIDQIKRARKKLGVIVKKGGMDGGWYLRLPGGPDPELPAKDIPKDSAEGGDLPPKSAKGAAQKVPHSSTSSAKNRPLREVFPAGSEPDFSTQPGFSGETVEIEL